MTMTSESDEFRDLLDRWEELRAEGQEPGVEELCRHAPHLAQRLREWTRVLKNGDWLDRRADEVADETLGEAGILTSGEREKHRVIGGYALGEELGSGGMGRVFKAIHCKMNRTVAVKLLPESLVRSPESVERFRREVQALARLSHRNIVAVHDAGTADGTHFYAMDFIDGDDLARLVREQGPMPVEPALDCILQAARGLEYAHAQGVVHRDIKPSNLILDHDGTVKILDLGIARFLPRPDQADRNLTKAGCVLGTIDYMAPEQAIETRLADQRADIYGLGCTLWFLLTGQPVFGGETVMQRLVAHREHPVPSLRKACPAAPAWLDGIFRKMIAKRPEDRYPSMTALICDLERRAVPARKRWVVVAVLIGLLAVLGVWLAVWKLPSPG
jgi:serine/threonine protein kinase